MNKERVPVALTSLSLALIGAALLSGPQGVSAAGGGGGHWIADPVDACGAGVEGDSYVGGCSLNASPSDNSVVFDDATGAGPNAGTAKNVYGGYSYSDDVDRNTVHIESGDIDRQVYGGYSDTQGSASENQVLISGGTIGGSVWGGASDQGDVLENSVTVTDGSIGHRVLGGYTSRGDASHNEVEISGGNILDAVFGGSSFYADARDNIVRMSGGSAYSVTGGESSNGVANDNQVIVSGNAITNFVMGGANANGSVGGNLVVVEGGTISANAMGGSSPRGDVIGNELRMTGGHIVGMAYGGVSQDAHVLGNLAVIGQGTVGSEVYGGYTNLGTAVGNQVTVQAGADIQGYIVGGDSHSGEAFENVVVIEGGNMADDVYGGATSDGAVSYNQVVIHDGVLARNVLGGFSDDGPVVTNRVTLGGGTVGGHVMGGFSDQANVEGNQVFVSGGTASDAVYGGLSDGAHAIGNAVGITGGVLHGEVVGGYSEHGNATGNVVHIMGGTIQADVYGGAVGAAGSSTGNRIILDGMPDLAGATLYGGSNPAAVSGNVLEVRSRGLMARNVGHFEKYHFLLPVDTQADDTVLTLTDAAGTDISGSTVGVAMQAGGNLLQEGDRVVLLHNASGVDASQLTQESLTAYQGISLEYRFGLDQDPNNLYAVTLGEATVRDQTKAPVEGRAAAVAFSRQAADLVAGEAMRELRHSGTGMFGVISGGKSRYKTGSHVDVNGVNLLLGLKRQFSLNSGELTAGAFFEGGWGRHHSYNSFGGDDVRGSGKADYLGVGILAHHQWESGLYVEGSLRGGRLKSDWSSSDMDGGDASYDSSASYLGAHAGLGYEWSLNEKSSVDLFAKYFWNRVGSDKVRIAGDPYHFKKTDSQRLRMGARLNYALTEQVTGYASAAWEREFDGRARATAYGLDTPSPQLKGNTGVFELGLSIEPDAKGPLTLGLGVQGYTGKRRGIGGTLDASWTF